MSLCIVKFIGVLNDKGAFGFIFFAEEALNVMALANSSRYVKDNAYKHAEITDVKVQISPILTLKKGVGLKISAAF